MAEKSGLVACSDCARYCLTGHAAQGTRDIFGWWHGDRPYRPRPGCGLTGEHLAPELARRCENFIDAERAAIVAEVAA